MTIDNDLVWQGPSELEGIGVHHDVFPMQNGNIIALTSQDTLLPVPEEIELPETYMYIDSLPWQGDRIVEWNRDGVEVWSWSVFDHFSFVDWNPNLYQDLLYTHPIPADFHYEWTHSNTVWYDPIDNAVYLSVRNMSRITKIDYDTGNIIWNMGQEMPSGDVTVGTDLGFSWQHSVKMLDNQNLMMYDNGNENDPFYSRGLEISFTETDSIPDTEIVWEYKLPDSVSSGLMSDCDRLPNGNSLLTSTTSNQILEVSPDSVKVWELLPFQEGSTFRSERIPGLFPQAFSVIQPDFIDEGFGPTIYLPSGETTLEYEIHNEGWMNETYEYSIIDNLGWFSETGTIEISPGIYAIIPMSGVIFDSGIIDTLIFTVIPQHAPLRYKVDTLFVDSQLSNAVGNVFPQKFELFPAFPNPFNPSTTIQFAVETMHTSTLKVYDINGRLVKTIVDEKLDQGIYSVLWKGTDKFGRPVSSGVYFYELQTEYFNQRRKMILLK